MAACQPIKIYRMERASVLFVFRLCGIWACIAGSWNAIQLCTPLFVKDMNPEAAPQMLGILQSTNALFGALFCIASGFFSDYLGRMTLLRPWVVIFVATIIATDVGVRIGSFYCLVLARIAAISIPTTILLAYLSDFLDGALLLQSYGFLSGTFGISLFSSSVICGVLNHFFSRFACLIFAYVLAFFALVLVFRTTPPTCVKEKIEAKALALRVHGNRRSATPAEFSRAIRLIVQDRYLFLICISCALVRLANMNDHLMMVFFIDFRTKASLSTISYILGLMALGTSASQLIVLSNVVRWRIVFPALVAALLVMFGCLLACAFAFSEMAFFYIVFTLGLTLFSTSAFNARISSLSSKSQLSGVTLGLVGTTTNTTEIFAAFFLSKLLAWSTQNYSRDSVLSGIPFLVNSGVVILSLALLVLAEMLYGRFQEPWDSTAKEGVPAAEALLAENADLQNLQEELV